MRVHASLLAARSTTSEQIAVVIEPVRAMSLSSAHAVALAVGPNLREPTQNNEPATLAVSDSIPTPNSEMNETQLSVAHK